MASCPICQKRKPKRFCPARAESICAQCCGTEREVTIDCPSDCPHLVASRQYETSRRAMDWSKVPFPEVRVDPSFVADHDSLLTSLMYSVCRFAQENRPTVDSDVLRSLQSLAESYRTLSSGLYYEKPPDLRLQRELYDAVKAGIADLKKNVSKEFAGGVRDSDIRDALIFLCQIGSGRANGRPKGRAFLDFMRRQFDPEAFGRPSSNVLIVQ